MRPHDDIFLGMPRFMRSYAGLCGLLRIYAVIWGHVLRCSSDHIIRQLATLY